MYGRVAIKKSTGKLIEFQSGDAPLGTLKQNAINAGFLEADVEEKYVTKAELDALMPVPAPANRKAEYSALTTDSQRIAYIANILGLL